jgi:hypothetical protein
LFRTCSADEGVHDLQWVDADRTENTSARRVVTKPNFDPLE